MPVRGDVQRRPARNSTSSGFRICEMPAPLRSVPPAQRGSPCESANLKCHQGAAVLQIDADPIPSRRLGVEVLAGPLVIEPRFAGHAVVAPLRATVPATRRCGRL